MDYKTAYNKIIDAYFKDEIKPLNAQFCFCGTLCDNSRDWYKVFKNKNEPHRDYKDYYNGYELAQMEAALLNKYNRLDSSEETLFEGMCAALEVLKNIHRNRGENVDDEPVFTKRVSVNEN